MDQTQTSATAGTAPASSEGAASNQQDPTLSRPANATGVEGGSAEGNRNSSSSDGNDGGDSDDGGRGRPGRAERRIHALTSRIEELEAKLASNSDLSMKLQSTRVDSSQVQLPDLSSMTEISADDLQKAVIKAAEQIVDAKMGVLASTLDQKVTRKDAAAKALREIADAKQRYAVLNENDEEHYNKELDEAIGNGYLEIYKANPSYSFTEYLKSFKPVLDAANTASREGASEGSGTNRGTSATRPTTSSHRATKAMSDMSLDELEAHIHAQNGR